MCIRDRADMEQLDSGQTVTGILEVMADGFGFIRSDHYLPGEHDVYVSPAPVSYTHLAASSGGTEPVRMLRDAVHHPE